MMMFVLICALSHATKNLSNVLLLKSGSKVLVTIKILSMLDAIICSSLSPRKLAPRVFIALRERKFLRGRIS
jgi:hypothetical protein